MNELNDFADDPALGHAASARALKSDFLREVEQIRKDTKLSDEGKAEAINARRQATEKTLAGYREKAEKADAALIAEVQGAVFGQSFPYGSTETEKEQIKALRRQAINEAERIPKSSEAVKALHRAHDDGDKLFVKALLKACYEKGWWDVLDEYARINPNAKDDIDRLSNLGRRANGGHGMRRRLSINGAFSLDGFRTPPLPPNRTTDESRTMGQLMSQLLRGD